MKRIINKSAIPAVFLAMTFLVPANSLARDRVASFDLEIEGAQRTDQFDWNIAGNTSGTDPNILSELTWTDLEINEVSIKGKLVMINNKVSFGGVLKASSRYGEIQSGENQDSDYGLDDRTSEWSRSNNRADWGEVWDTNIGFGLLFMSKGKMFSITPLIGYSYRLQSLKIHDGYQTIYLPDPSKVGPITGLNSTYDAEWQTGWVGLELEFKPSPHFEIYGSVEYHEGQYEAEADWNLRTDLDHPISFTHESDEASGVASNIGIRIGWRNILLNAELRFREFKAEDGTAKTYLATGTKDETLVNEVNWESTSVGGGLTVRF